MPVSDAYDPVFREAGTEWNVDPRLLKAMAGPESSGNPRAVSSAGAQGLMQIVPRTQAELGITDPMDPVQSIWGAAKYMAQALDAEKTPEDALRYYHGGPDWRSPEKYGPESRNYVPLVTAAYRRVGDPSSAKPAATAALGLGAGTVAKAATKTDATDDFLSGKTSPAAKPAAVTAAPAGPDATDDFLSGKGAAPAASTPAPSGYTPENPTFWGMQPTKDSETTAAFARVGSAAVKGYQDTPPIFTPKMQALLDQDPSGIGRFLVNPLAHIAGVVPAGFNALGAGAAAAIGEGANALGQPALGRDFNMLAQVAPFAHIGTGLPLGGAPMTRTGAVGREMQAPVAPKFIPGDGGVTPADTVAAPLPEAFRSNPLAAGYSGQPNALTPELTIDLGGGKTIQVPTRDAPPAPSSVNPNLPPNALAVGPDGRPIPPPSGVPGEAPQARSVGAAASRDLSSPGTFEMTPADVKANRRQAEMKEINTPAGLVDHPFVEGADLTLAQRAADPAISQREVMLRQRNPGAFEGEGGVLTKQNEAVINKYQAVTPSDTQIASLRKEQSALAQTDKATVMENARPADLRPAEAHLDGLMADPRIQENPDVMAVLTKLKATLYDADGNLKTDPMSVWGMHDNVKNLIEKSKDRTSTERFAQSQLIDYKNVIDGVMNKATGDHFQTFLDHYADYAKQINAGELLGKFGDLHLTNNKGIVQANRFHNFVLDLAYSRGTKGLDPSMDIPDTTMQNLIAIDHHLKQAGLIDMGAARGSPTNLFGVLAKDMGIGMAHLGVAAAGVSHGGIGNILMQGAINRGSAALNTLRLNSLTRTHLAPPKGGWKPIPEQYRTPDYNALRSPD